MTVLRIIIFYVSGFIDDRHYTQPSENLSNFQTLWDYGLQPTFQISEKILNLGF
jgi:hypothetical protein